MIVCGGHLAVITKGSVLIVSQLEYSQALRWVALTGTKSAKGNWLADAATANADVRAVISAFSNTQPENEFG